MISGTADNRFTTILPPNNPSCFFAYSVSVTLPTGGSFSMDLSRELPYIQHTIATPTSNHTGGVNCVFLDGAVRFVSDSVDYQSGGTNADGSPRTWNTLPDKDGMRGFFQPSGQSVYGVWGALGTPSGGESKSL